jgi:predicted O-methyltransferase YrrM
VRLYDRAVIYWEQCEELLRDFPASTNIVDLVWYYPSWYFNLDRKHTPMADELPWLTFAAIRRLNRILRPSMRIFEYGSGGSTLFFARRAASVTSIEHDPHWSEIVATSLQTHGYSNCELRLIQPCKTDGDFGGDPSDPGAYGTSDVSLSGFSFLNYASSIDTYPDGHFDLVCIDGRARPSCFKHALPKVTIGGYIVWDNSERETYQPALEAAAAHCRRSDYRGPISGHVGFVQTSILQRDS